MSPSLTFTDSSIVMAEQSSRDVVDQTLSGGEPSPSDVPASTTDNTFAGEDVGETKHIATSSGPQISTMQQSDDVTRDTTESQGGRAGGASDPLMDAKQGAGLVASRALELNGLASGSDGGDDTASQGGSESDTSRTDGRHHHRTGSVKKPTAFGKVSFTKFTVPKAPGASAPSKAPEKVTSTSTTPLGTPQPSSRPRLVAKTTGGMRDSISRTGAGGAKSGGSGPDPTQVWNKNRPVQPIPPKHLTDEELKQQYGIHMTSRIQEDGGGTESKWADIDDDEDDWAPETIEWTDGTKVTLTHNESMPPPEQIPDVQTETPLPEQTVIQDPIKIAAPKPTTSVGPNPTVLRLGANAERQAKAASISRGPNDRFPSGSTSPAPPPAKSPWATLPPVERVSPVVNAPFQPPPTVSQHRVPVHHPHREDGHHAPPPTHQIAADDFNRAWKEPSSAAPRELYNSRSGQLEPVADTRRGSWRPDQGPRPPAVLQRPGHGDHNGPAEPSAAFQTHRSSHQDGMGWNRRRTSSNVSGGSGSFGRRMSFGRDAAPRYSEGRRGSHANEDWVDPALSREPGHFQESFSHRHAGPSRPAPPSVSIGSEASPVESHAAPTAVPEVPQEDPVVLQERIMKEKRLEARQRRLDQEEKEKQARDERIRQKLAALGPPPEKKRKDSLESRKPPAAVSSTSPTTISSPPKPPVPEPTGEPKQYGMMKVHHPDAVKKLVAANERERAAEKQADKPSPHLRRSSSPHHLTSKRDPAPPSFDQPQPSEPRSQDSKVDEQGDHWRGNLNVPNSYVPWSAPNLPSTSPSVNNLWKPLSSDRTLGNGIFDQALGGFPSRELPLRSQLGLDQPTMPASQSFAVSQDPTPVPNLPSPETRAASFDPLSPIGRPGPIGPPSSMAPNWPQARGVSAWNNFGPMANKRESEQNQKYRQEFNDAQKLRQEMPKTQAQEKPESLKHTWKKVLPDRDARQMNAAVNADAKPISQSAAQPDVAPILGSSPAQNLRPAAAVANPLNGIEDPADARPISYAPARGGSRFFPHAGEQSKRTHRSPSPPPPEEVSHPVYSNGSGRPLVHLPTPKPVVKLPPKAVAVAATPVPPPTFASMAAAAPPRAKPSSDSSTIDWQEKINGLLGKKSTHDSKGVLAVASASKVPLDVQLPVAAVSVSLPSNVEVHTQTGDGDIAAKQVAEGEEIFEDREPGSQPGVRLPNMAPPAAWHAAVAPQPSRVRLKPTQVSSIDPNWSSHVDKDAHGNIRATVLLPGQEVGKVVILNRKHGQHTPRHRNTPNANRARKGLKPRDPENGSSWTKKPSSQQTGSSESSHRNQSRSASWGQSNQGAEQ
ncbi:hypothetical protein N7478_002423 [Penicillium angulare]|uniref:uncharacterized protein n=1 Tax=Penicillium angulare TaxID=116970 RepID=UPI00253FDA1E|nr:uncharacterized protein N7478_002423 [Penicillium angulare]KAJ5286737.1 hypothetical protein N7478_002423 [Penicillium angulare]